MKFWTRKTADHLTVGDNSFGVYLETASELRAGEWN